MATQTDLSRKRRLEQVKREMYRKSLDELRVFNPLSEDRIVVYGGFSHRVPSKEETVLVRYIAEKFVKETIDFMINKDESEAVEKENNRRKKNGHPLLTAQEREQFDISQKLTTSNEVLREKYMKIVYKGVAKQYGFEMPEQKAIETDRRSADTRLMEKFDEETPPEVVDEVKKEELEKSIGEKKN